MLEIDHAVLAVPDLEDAGRRLDEASGLRSVPGGTHERWGTANRIVPLGPSYIELIAIHDRDVAAANELGRRITAVAGSPSPWVTWVLRTDRLGSLAARLGLEVTEATRDLPDGRVLRWRMSGLDESLAAPPLPFFMEWDVPPEDHPGSAALEHRTAPRGIAWIEVSGDESRLRRWLGDASLPVRVVPGTPGIRTVAIATSGGTLELRGTEVRPGSA